MFSLLLDIAGIDPATGRVLNNGAASTVKKAAKKVAKKATQAAVDAATKAAQAAQTAADTVATTTATAAATNTQTIATPAAAPIDATSNSAAAAAAPAAAATIVADSEPSALSEFFASLDPVIVALVVGALLLVAYFIYRRRFSATGQVGDRVLLLGPMGAGKTCLYYQLKQGIARDTQTSMKENDETFVVKPLEGKISAWRYVDLPGHASQRVKLETLKSVAKAVVFVLDGATATTPDQMSKIAQFLYTLLVDPVFVARRTPFFIAINKTDRLDLDTATATDDEEADTPLDAAIDRIATQLEKTLDRTRKLQSTMVELGSTDETRVRTLGRPDEPFQFGHSTCPISFGGISALKGELQDVLGFLQTL